jgi:hypothetical protein
MLQPFLLRMINKYCQFINCKSNQKYEKNLFRNRRRGYLVLNSNVFRVVWLTMFQKCQKRLPLGVAAFLFPINPLLSLNAQIV